MIRAYSLLRRAGKPGLCLLESRRHRKIRIWLSGGGIIAPPFGSRELMTPGGGRLGVRVHSHGACLLKEGINESGGSVRSGKWCGRRAFPTADLRRRMILRPAEFVAMPRHRYGMSGIGPEANPRLSPYLLKADGAERREKRSRSEKASLKKGGEARASMLFGETSFPIGLRAAGAESLPTFSGAVLKKCAHSDIIYRWYDYPTSLG
jgi:hypothetical protein